MEAVERRVLLSAYALNQLASFGINAAGVDPASTLVADSAGNLYGTASAGGPYGQGTVFEIAHGSNTITTLAAFNGTNGSAPRGSLAIDPSGNLYGATTAGGPYTDKDGTVFELPQGSNVVTTLVAFADKLSLSGGVTLDPSGNLFWTAQAGEGAVFELAKGSLFPTRVDFTGANGAYPYAGVTSDASGNVYGTTTAGGAYGDGTVFEIASGSSTITTVASFSSWSVPEATVTLDPSGNLFGTTHNGGTHRLGTVFEIAKGSNAVTTLATLGGGFLIQQPAGPNSALMLDASGNLYGTTDYGGSHREGTVFELARGSTVATTLASFNYNDAYGESRSVSSIMLDASGNLFGMNYGSVSPFGATSNGEVFEVAAGTQTMTSIATFDPVNGVKPEGTVVADAAGDVFGMTAGGGGLAFSGNLYEVASGSNTISPIEAITPGTGLYPASGLLQDASGNIYGLTHRDGAYGAGTVFEIAAGSTAITTVASFNTADGANPTKLTIDGAGNLYGITSSGGAANYGGEFEIARGSNAITTLSSFVNGGESGLTLDASGNLYGMTETTNIYYYYSVFEVPKGANAQTTLASFRTLYNNGQLGTDLAEDAAGNVYGTWTGGNGSFGQYGSVFEIARGSGASTTLASFNRTNGSTPAMGVIMDASGNLFGTTASVGTVFEVAKGSKTITTLISFTQDPANSLALDARGNLFGTSSSGGLGHAGTVFELAANTAVSLTPGVGTNPADPIEPLTFTAALSGGVPDGEMVNLLDTSNNNAVVATGSLRGGSATLTIPAGTLSIGTHNLMAAFAGDTNFAASESAPYAQTVRVLPPTLAGAPVINGDDPNGLYTAPGQPSPGVQRSMVQDVVYTFNKPVVIPDANAAFTVHVAGTIGTVPPTLIASAVPGSNGSKWAVSLTGQPVGALASIANGEYSITINPGAVFAAEDGTTSMAPGTGETDTFYRLFGDINGDRIVNNTDNFQLIKARFTYNPAFDYNADGTVNARDNVPFHRDHSIDFQSDGFVTTI
jgi:uncharacterized repeat protein (TIGR03803 family)